MADTSQQAALVRIERALVEALARAIVRELQAERAAGEELKPSKKKNVLAGDNSVEAPFGYAAD